MVGIAVDKPRAAQRLARKLQSRTQSLLDTPRIGKLRPDLFPTARAITEGKYLILYRLQPDTHAGPVARVVIVRVVHGSRDLEQIFRDR